MTDPHWPYPAGGAALAPARRRYLSPTDRKRRLEALIGAASAGLDACVAEARHEILRGLHLRERDGLAVIEALVPDPETVLAALQAAGFTCETHGMLIRAERPIRRCGG
jgi:hypothetical protein